MNKASVPKTLHNFDQSKAKDNIEDLVIFGDTDQFKLLCKASSESEGFMKATKAMEIKNVGCIVQVTTQQRNADGSYTLAEALQFVPRVTIVGNKDDGRRLVSYEEYSQMA